MPSKGVLVLQWNTDTNCKSWFKINGLYCKWALQQSSSLELLHETLEKKNNPLQLQKFDYHFPQSIPDCLHIIVNI